MLLQKLVITTTLLSLSVAKRPTNTSICDYYTEAILGSNTATSQSLFITLFFNTVVIGNYTTPNTGISVAGIAGPGVYNGTNVALLPYFNGGLASSNNGSAHGVSKLFLDDGGPVPLGMNMSSNGSVDSNQYKLITHVYQYFGVLLGCSLQGGPDFPSYLGKTSMYDVHKYMDLDQYQLGFFSKQCTDALSSLGLASSDVAIFGNTLIKLFYTRCAPPVAIPSIMAPPEKQSICIAPSCPLDPMHQCAAYPNNGTAVAPLVANATLVGNITSSEIAARNSTITYVATNRGVSQRSLGLSLVASGSILLLL